jgi:general secretion pathway protein H
MNCRHFNCCSTILQRGFTLLEIMVVVVLIGLTVTLVGLNLGRDLDQVAGLEAKRFAKLLEYLRDESVLTGTSYAIEVDEQKKMYRFLESSGKWLPVKNDDLLRPRRFPEYLSVKMDIFQKGEDDSSEFLIVQGLGEITPFQLVVTGDEYLHIVKLDDSFNIMVEQVDPDAI